MTLVTAVSNAWGDKMDMGYIWKDQSGGFCIDPVGGDKKYLDKGVAPGMKRSRWMQDAAKSQKWLDLVTDWLSGVSERKETKLLPRFLPCSSEKIRYHILRLGRMESK